MPNAFNGIEVLYGQQTMDNSIAVVLPSDQEITVNSTSTLTSGGLEGSLTLTSANTPYELKIGLTRLPNRKLVTCFSFDGLIYWGYTNTITSSTGTPIYKDQLAAWKMDDQGTIYVLTPVAGRTVRITESP